MLGFYAFYDEVLWPAVFGLSGATGLIECMVLPFCPESPRWLLIKKKNVDSACTGENDFRSYIYLIDLLKKLCLNKYFRFFTLEFFF